MTSEFPWRGSRLPRSMTALAVVMGVGALGLGGCLPSDGSDGRDARVTDEDIDEIVDRVVDRLEPPPEVADWGPEFETVAFYPNQANLQWLAGLGGYNFGVDGEEGGNPHGGSGSDQLTCAGCHGDFGGVPTQLGDNLVGMTGGIDGKSGHKSVTLRAAFDETHVYLEATWETDRDRAGMTHQAFRVDDGTWGRGGGVDTQREFETQYGDLAEDEFFNYEDRFAVMIAPRAGYTETMTAEPGGGEVTGTFQDMGCFMACHSSLRRMPHSQDEPDTGWSDPIAGQGDMRHYLLDSRDYDTADDMGNFDDFNDFDRDGRLLAGRFLDMWQFRAARSAPMDGASNDYVMEYRNSGIDGQNFWFNHSDAILADGTQQPDWVDTMTYDADADAWSAPDAPNDLKAEGTDFLTDSGLAQLVWVYDDQIMIARHGEGFADGGWDEGQAYFRYEPGETVVDDGERNRDIAQEYIGRFNLMVQGPNMNARPATADDIDNAPDGSMLPRRVLRNATGARGDLEATSEWDDGTWTVVFRRELDTGNLGDHSMEGLQNGVIYDMAAGVFDDHVSNRDHHVTFPFSVGGPGSGANLEAADRRD